MTCPRCGYKGESPAEALKRAPIKLRYTIGTLVGDTLHTGIVRVGYTHEERRNGVMEASMRLIASKSDFLRWLEYEPPTIENILGRTGLR
jgi:hypothetical protein